MERENLNIENVEDSLRFPKHYGLLKSEVYSSSYGQIIEGENSAKIEHDFTTIKTLSNLNKNSIKT